MFRKSLTVTCCYFSKHYLFILTHTLQDCGADCAKFQKSELEFKFNKRALERPYTSKHSWGKTYGEHKRHLELSHEQYRELQKYAEEVGIFFTASGMDEVRKILLKMFCDILNSREVSPCHFSPVDGSRVSPWAQCAFLQSGLWRHQQLPISGEDCQERWVGSVTSRKMP